MISQLGILVVAMTQAPRFSQDQIVDFATGFVWLLSHPSLLSVYRYSLFVLYSTKARVLVFTQLSPRIQSIPTLLEDQSV